MLNFSGGSLPANRRCTLTVDVTMDVNGNLTNTIPVDGVTTFNGVSNSQPTQATLTNLPGVSISKYFSSDDMLAEPGQYTLLTIQLENTGNIVLTGLGFIDQLPGTLPDGLFVAGGSEYPDAPAPTNTCGGSLSADAGQQRIELSGGGLGITAASKHCVITVPVAGTSAGVYTNVIPANTLVSNEEATNVDPASDSLRVRAAPQLQIRKMVLPPADYSAGDTINYRIEVINLGDITLTGVTVTDPGADLTSCDQTLPAVLAPTEQITCLAAHVVTAEDASAGTYTNTAFAASNQTGSVSDDVTVPIGGPAALSIEKFVTSSGPYTLGSQINYTIRVQNIGSAPLNHVIMTELGSGVVVDSCTAPQIVPMLTQGEEITCQARHTVTQADLDAGQYTNTAVANSLETQPVSSTVTVPLSQTPGMSLFKQVVGTPPFLVGSSIPYEIAVLNTGNVTLTHVTVSDPGAGMTLGACSPALPATLPVGGLLTCSASHVVTQANVDAGIFMNTAFADSDQTSPVSGSAKTAFVQMPALSITKTASLNMAVAAPAGRLDAGDQVTYGFTITNTGNVTLTNISITDALPGLSISGEPFTLAPGQSNTGAYSGVYTLTQADINRGSLQNTASVTGTPPSAPNVGASDDHTQALARVPSIDLQKTAILHMDVVPPNDRADAGDTITWAFTITNTGNVTLTNVSLTDLLSGMTLTGSPIASLAPGESSSSAYSGTSTVTQQMLNTGFVENNASVSGLDPAGNAVTHGASARVNLVWAADISLQKTGTLNPGSNGRADAGDTITYVFTVTNTGNIPLDEIVLIDSVEEVTVSGTLITELLPGLSDSDTFTGTYTLTQADIEAGIFNNYAVAFGISALGVEMAEDDDTQTLAADPAITLLKTGTLHMDEVAPADRVDAGDTITWAFTVTNTGNVILYDITLEDLVSGVALSGAPIASLAPGESNSTAYTAAYTLTAADVEEETFSNSASVSAHDGDDTPVSAEGQAENTWTNVPSLTLEKTVTPHPEIVAPAERLDAGDTLTFGFTVTNTGNVALTNVQVIEEVSGVTLSGAPIARLEPGESSSTAYTAVYTLTLEDLNEGVFTNRASMEGTPLKGTPVSAEDEIDVPLAGSGALGLSKRVTETPIEAEPGVWDVTFEIIVRNYSNVTLHEIQVEDDLQAAFPADIAEDLQVRSLTSADLTVDELYDGITHLTLLAGTDALAPGEQGLIRLIVRVTPISGGPFANSAAGSALTPTDEPVEDVSQRGDDADPDADWDPGNNDEPTPINFGNLFKPPVGVKRLASASGSTLNWSMRWMNNANIQPLLVAIHDSIPAGTAFLDNGVSSGVPLPAGELPPGSKNTGVACLAASTDTITTACYYEGPTTAHPRGQIIWQGTLAPDFGVTNPALALNAVQISFSTRVNTGVDQVTNVAEADADLDGSLVLDDPAETTVADAAAAWQSPQELPGTGFAPGRVTWLPEQAGTEYLAYSDLSLEIPALRLNIAVVGVPQNSAGWDVSWLGSSAGYLNGTAFPGWQGNSVITAHVYGADGLPGPFAGLKNLKWGDVIYLHAYGSVYEYEVRSTAQLLPDDLSILSHKEQAWLTLLTCQSYNESSGLYRYRYAVQAVLMRVRAE